jgi:hypothetical protein
MSELVRRALTELATLENAGFDGVLVENDNDQHRPVVHECRRISIRDDDLPPATDDAESHLCDNESMRGWAAGWLRALG